MIGRRDWKSIVIVVELLCKRVGGIASECLIDTLFFVSCYLAGVAFFAGVFLSFFLKGGICILNL